MKSHQGNEFPKTNRKKVIAMKKSEQENIITVSHLNKEFVKDGTSFQVLKDIDLSVKKGEFVTIVGHSQKMTFRGRMTRENDFLMHAKC